MTDHLEHPAPRIVHAVNNALQVLLLMSQPERSNAQSLRMDAAEVRRLLEPVLPDVAVLHEYVQVQEANLLTMAQESNETHRLLTAEQEKNTALNIMVNGANKALAEAQNTAEELVRDLAPLVGQVSQLFTRARGIRLYDDMASLPRLTTANLEAPRAAAAGSR